MLPFIEENGIARAEEAAELLEHFAEARGLKEEELEVIGEVLSNIYGSIAVSEEIKDGVPEKEALNAFMKRVQGAIDS